ncbi:MAG: RimJ/RimL family protein N-acetyltransferase [Flavobacteriales bacterium]
MKVDGAIAGSIGIHPQEDVYAKNAELGCWLAEEYGKRYYDSSSIENDAIWICIL